jgi:hypothetical protein
MIEWVNGTSVAERWIYGLALTAIAGLIIQWFNQRLSHSLAIRREKRKNRVVASESYLAAFNIEHIPKMQGHELHNCLLGTIAGDGTRFEGEYFIHKKVVQNYRVHLGLVERFRFNYAWAKYHGGNEDNPDLFKQYCVKELGQDVLFKRLTKLKRFGVIS